MTEKFNPINFWNKHRYSDAENDESNQQHREQRSVSVDQANNASAQREPVQVLPSNFGTNPPNLEQDSNYKHETDDMASRKAPNNFELFKMKSAQPPDYKSKADSTHDENISFFGDSNVARRTSRSTLDQDSLHRGNISTLPSAGTTRRSSEPQQSIDSSTGKPTLMGRASAAVASVGAVGAAAAGLGISNELKNKSKVENTAMPSTWPDSPKVNNDELDEPAIHGQHASFRNKDKVCDNITESETHSFCDRVEEPTIQGQIPSFYGHEDNKSSTVNNRQAINTIDAVNNNNQTVNNNDTVNNKDNMNRLSGGFGSLFGTSSNNNNLTTGNREASTEQKSNKSMKGLLASAGAASGIGAGLGFMSHHRKSQTDDASTPQMLPDVSTKEHLSDGHEASQDYKTHSGSTTVFSPGLISEDKSVNESTDELPKTWGDQSRPISRDEAQELNTQSIENPSTHAKITRDDDITPLNSMGGMDDNTRSVSDYNQDIKTSPVSKTDDRDVSQNDAKSHSSTSGILGGVGLGAGIGAAVSSILGYNNKSEDTAPKANDHIEQNSLDNSNVYGDSITSPAVAGSLGGSGFGHRAHSTKRGFDDVDANPDSRNDQFETNNREISHADNNSHTAAGMLGGAGVGAGLGAAATHSMLNRNTDSELTPSSKVDQNTLNDSAINTDDDTLNRSAGGLDDYNTDSNLNDQTRTGISPVSSMDQLKTDTLPVSNVDQTETGTAPISKIEQYESSDNNNNLRTAAGVLGGAGLGGAATHSILNRNKDDMAPTSKLDQSMDWSDSKVNNRSNTLDSNPNGIDGYDEDPMLGDQTRTDTLPTSDSQMKYDTLPVSNVDQTRTGTTPISDVDNRDEQLESRNQGNDQYALAAGALGGAGMGAGLGAAANSMMNRNKNDDVAPISKLDHPIDQSTLNDPRVNNYNDKLNNNAGGLDGYNADPTLDDQTRIDTLPVSSVDQTRTETTPISNVDNRDGQLESRNQGNNKLNTAAGVLGGAGVGAGLGAAANSMMNRNKNDDVAPISKLDHPIDQSTLNDPRVNSHNDKLNAGGLNDYDPTFDDQTRIDSLPASNTNQMRSNSLPVSNVDQTGTASNMNQTRTGILPISNDNQMRGDDIPASNVDQMRSDTLPVSNVDQTRTDGLSNTDQTAPVTDNRDESKDHDNKSHAAAGILGGAGLGAAIGSVLGRDKKSDSHTKDSGLNNSTLDKNAVPVSVTDVAAEPKAFGNNEEQAFGGNSAFGNGGAATIVNKVAPVSAPLANEAATHASKINKAAPVAASAPVVHKSLKMNPNDSHIEPSTDNLDITQASSHPKPINLDQPWTDKEVSQPAVEPRNWSNAEPAALGEESHAMNKADREVPASEARRWSKSGVPPSHHVEKRLAVGGIMGATANVEGVRGLNHLYPENSHHNFNEPIKSRLGEDEITDQPRRRSSLSETVGSLFGLNKHKDDKHEPINEDSHTQAHVSSDVGSHNKAALAGGNVTAGGANNQYPESMSSTRATTGQIVPDARNVEVKDRTDAPHHNMFTEPNNAPHNSTRRHSSGVTQGIKMKAAALTHAVRRLSKQGSSGSIKKDSIHVRRLSDAEVFKNNTLGKQNAFGNNKDAAVGTKLPTTTTGMNEESTTGHTAISRNAVAPMAPDHHLDTSDIGPLSTEQHTGVGPLSTEQNAMAGVAPHFKENNAMNPNGVHPLNDTTEPLATNDLRRNSSTDSEHLKYTGVQKGTSQIPGVHSLKPTEEPSGKDFMKREERKTSMGTLLSGQFENRRGSFQKTMGRLFGSENMQDKGTLKELSGQQKVNAYRAARNQL